MKVMSRVKAPKLYIAASKIAKAVKEEGRSLNDLVYSEKYRHYNIKALYALVADTLSRGALLDRIIERSKILEKEQDLKFHPWLLRILLTELLWKKQRLPPCGKKIETIVKYRSKFLAEIEKAKEVGVSEPSNGLLKKASRARWVRVNTLVTSVKDVIARLCAEDWEEVILPEESNYAEFLKVVSNLSDNQFIRDYHIAELLCFPSKTNFTTHELYESAAVVLQDKASLIPVIFLDPCPGSVVLDMCAGPGMKTTYIAARMSNRGSVYAVERNYDRYRSMCKIVNNHRASCVKLIHEDSTLLDPALYSSVEYILVDPSCSGSGMVDRIPVHGNEESDSARLRKLSHIQFLLLKNALTLFPNAKRVVYSTCSVCPEENEQVIENVLRHCNEQTGGPKFNLYDLSRNCDWFNFGSSSYSCGQSCLYAKPDSDFTNGFFVAVFVRDESDKTESKTYIQNNFRNSNTKPKRKKRKYSA